MKAGHIYLITDLGKAGTPFDHRKFSQRLRKHRHKLQLNLREAGKSATVSYNTIKRIEDGQRPQLDIFIKCCKWMGLSTEEFVKP